MTRSEFNQCRKLMFEVKELEEAVELESRVYYPKIPTLTGLPKPTDLERDAGVIKHLEHVEQLKRSREKLYAMRIRAEEAIEILDDTDTRRIMRMFYLRGMKWDEIADAMFMDVSSCFRKRNKALEQLKYY